MQAIADRLRQIDDTLAEWEANWPGNANQQGAGASVSDGSHKPRMRLPEVPKLGLKPLTDKNYKDWIVDMDLQLGTYWIEIEMLPNKCRKSKEVITESMVTEWSMS